MSQSATRETTGRSATWFVERELQGPQLGCKSSAVLFRSRNTLALRALTR